mmetsp:Transcript_12656/g.37063  ORF Transcript_12656/g.37063 Transcript_12656/m.37063 type:complete len:261 (+) Transcript_12656:263-1045(+)
MSAADFLERFDPALHARRRARLSSSPQRQLQDNGRVAQNLDGAETCASPPPASPRRMVRHGGRGAHVGARRVYVCRRTGERIEQHEPRLVPDGDGGFELVLKDVSGRHLRLTQHFKMHLQAARDRGFLLSMPPYLDEERMSADQVEMRLKALGAPLRRFWGGQVCSTWRRTCEHGLRALSLVVLQQMRRAARGRPRSRVRMRRAVRVGVRHLLQGAAQECGQGSGAAAPARRGDRGRPSARSQSRRGAQGAPGAAAAAAR